MLNDLVTVGGFFALVTTIALQLVKPFLERIPGLTLPANRDLHDATLRAVGYALNLGLLALAAHTNPELMAGLAWYAVLAVAFGQSVASHVAYATATSGKVDAPVGAAPVELLQPVHSTSLDDVPVAPR